jgi:hypothetical protein
MAGRKEAIRALPKEIPRIFRIQTVQVSKTSLFSFESNQYSVPKEYARKTLRIEINELDFAAFSGSEEIERWSRTLQRNQRFIQEEHYKGRFKGNKESLLEKEFYGLCPEASLYLKGLVDQRGTSLREQMEKIIGLAMEFSVAEISQAMIRALEFGNYGYDSLKRILVKLQEAPESLPQSPSPKSGILDTNIQIEVETRELSYYAGKGGESWSTSWMA